MCTRAYIAAPSVPAQPVPHPSFWPAGKLPWWGDSGWAEQALLSTDGSSVKGDSKAADKGKATSKQRRLLQGGWRPAGSGSAVAAEQQHHQQHQQQLREQLEQRR